MLKYLSLVLLIVLCISISGSNSSLAQPPPPPTPAVLFGVVDGYWRPTAATDLGVGWDRITFDWSRFQPNGPGDFEAEAVRPEWVSQSIEAGREVAGMIVNTPPWASRTGAPSAVPAGLFRSASDPENLWAVFLQQLVREFAPQGLHTWIIWNNIDIAANERGHAFDGGPDEYLQMIRIAHEVIFQIDPEARLLLGALVWQNDVAAGREPYLQRFLQSLNEDQDAAAYGYYFDGVTLNILIQPNEDPENRLTTDSVSGTISGVRELLNNANLGDKSLWVTELNASATPTRRQDPSTENEVTLQQQRDFILQGTALAIGAGADRVAVYRLYDDGKDESSGFGLIRRDNSYRPAYDAYRLAINLFSNTEAASLGRSTNARLVSMSQRGRTIFVMWSAATTPVSFWIEARFGDELSVMDADGNILPQPRQGVGPENTTVHVIDTPPAQADEDGQVWVSGTPRIVILRTEDDRRVWGSTGNGIGIQLR